MSAPQPALTPDFAVAQRELMLQGLERELQVTKEVLSTVPDSNRDCRLDSKSRTAGELAWHLASSDVQMLDEIADHKFEMAPLQTRIQEHRRPCQLVRNKFPARRQSRSRHDSRAVGTPVDFAGVFKMPAVFYLGFVSNHSVHHRG